MRRQDTSASTSRALQRSAGPPSVPADLSQWPARVAAGERGAMGAPRSPGPLTRERRAWRGRPGLMLRLLHTADVHLGARHADLGDRASAQRERQFAAFVATIDLAIAEQVDLVLIAGDLFDSNVQPRRSVDRVAGQLCRLVDSRIRTVITPGTHDVYDGASIYRSYDLADLAGSGGSAGSAGAEFVTVLT